MQAAFPLPTGALPPQAAAHTHQEARPRDWAWRGRTLRRPNVYVFGALAEGRINRATRGVTLLELKMEREEWRTGALGRALCPQARRFSEVLDLPHCQLCSTFEVSRDLSARHVTSNTSKATKATMT